MGRVCEICSSENRNNIDRELLDGRTMANIARKYDVKESSLYYHKHNGHLSSRLEKSYALKQQTEDFDILNRIEKIVQNTELIFKRNFDKKKDYLALKALDSQRNTFELLSKILFAHHSTKVAELEIIRESNNAEQNESAKANAKAFVDSLEILSEEERQIWEKLYGKIINQDENIDALQSIKKDLQPIIETKQEFKKDFPKVKEIEQPKHEIKIDVQEKEKEQPKKDFPKVQPVESQKIYHTKKTYQY